MLIGSDFVHYVIKWMTKGREMLAGTGTTVEAKTEEGRQLAKHLEALDSLTSEDAIQTVKAGQLEIHFS